MATFRGGREEQKQQRRLIAAIGGIVGILLFLVVLGPKLLISFSLFLDQIRGGSNQPASTSQAFIPPPTLDPLFESTNSATLAVTGHGKAKFTLIAYLNEKEAKKLTVADDGTFKIPLTGIEGDNTISAKLVDDQGNSSTLSNVLTVTINKKPPLMEVTAPQDNASVNGDTNTVTVSGRTEEGNTITVNDHVVIVNTGGSFTYQVTLVEGDNTINVVATDPAGNTTKVERKVTYHK